MTGAIGVFDSLLEVAVLLGKDMDSHLGSMGLTPSRTHLLWELHIHGPVTQRELATQLSVTARNITGLVDALESDGFVLRSAHPTDRRALIVTLTSLGQRTMRKMEREKAQLAEAVIADLRTGDVEDLDRLLSIVVARLRQLVQPS